ncbi:thioesterase II family protein [Paraburkholderia hayleyella]|uniref:thioesterase II family protein n=1 Tax=Paraburkholderia hayleyella TaxID=2152889 RepID=UPI0024837807|nr:alpha/beta fold hydrolase [Paraburkholderia hayleyella]
MMPGSRLLRPVLSAPQNAPHLLLCPFAGASSSAFRSWRSLAGNRFGLSLVVYPGREHRMREPCAEQTGELAAPLAAEIATLAEAQRRTLLLAGHSMGAQVAFETCLLLERAHCPPAGLVLSGCHAPHLRSRRRLSALGDEAFVASLSEIGGMSPELLAEPSLLALFMPLLRADFRATEGYRREQHVGHPRVRTPTLLLHGSDDREASRDEVEAWDVWLHDTGPPVTLAGDHFYLTTQPHAFAEVVLRHFEPILASR